MDIRSITNSNKIEALIYMENKINSGSPSGFSGEQDVLGEFASGRLSPFKLPIIESSREIMNFSLGTCIHDYLIKDNFIPIHPLFLKTLCEKGDNLANFQVIDYIDAYVTASGRTVLVKKENCTHFLKLHFPGVLGRVNRHIPLRKGIAGVEISALVGKYIKSNELGPIGLLPEIKCVGITSDGNGIDEGSWSYVERCGTIITHFGNDHASVLIPAFSTFASDPADKNGPTILNQLCMIHNINSLDKFIEIFILPLIDAYLRLTFNFGLMPEINAQNLLFAYSSKNDSIYPVLRDMGRVEKLPYINEEIGRLKSCPYKTNTLDIPNEYAKIRHSFSFDFKLCGYIINPMLESFCKFAGLSFDESKIYLSHILGMRMDEGANVRDYLPRNRRMMGHPKQLLTHDRPYIDCGIPYII